jgi:hypothetical protein
MRNAEDIQAELDRELAALDDHAELVYRYLWAKREQARIEAELKEARDQLVKLLPPGVKGGTLGGSQMVSIQWRTPSTRLDQERLKRDWKRAYEDCLVEPDLERLVPYLSPMSDRAPRRS